MPTSADRRTDRLAIYGGSFSPPHLGHVAAAEAFCRAVKPERLLVMPSRVPPHKTLDGGASDADRLAMCRLAFGASPTLSGCTEVSDYELTAERVSYTYYTLQHFAPTAKEIYLLVGTDMLLTFEEWKNFREIFSLVTLCFAERRSASAAHRAETDAAIARYRERYGARILRLEYPAVEVSSSEVREALNAGRATDGLLSADVREYIEQNKLYGVPNER